MIRAKKLSLGVAAVALCLSSMQGAVAAPRDSDKLIDLGLQDLVSHPDYAAKAPTDIKFFYGDQPVKVVKVLGPVKTSRKSNKKSDLQGSCRWAMLGALIALGEEARLQGGNAVINIKSNFGNVETSSQTSYKCGVGTIMVGVALTGEVAIVE